MSHQVLRDRLGDYLEGDLGTAERSAVDAHLAQCASCREELRGLRATVALLRSLPDPEPPADLAASVMARIDAERRPALLRRLDPPRVALALAAGLAGLAFLWTWQGSDPSGHDSFPGAQAMPWDAAGGTTTRSRRPSAVVQPSAARPRAAVPGRIAAFGSGVAPLGDFAELPADATSSREIELDRQLARLLDDPSAFLQRMGPSVRGDGFARLAQHAARRHQAGTVASRLIAVPHPLADELVPRFLAASLAADLERRHGHLE